MDVSMVAAFVALALLLPMVALGMALRFLFMVDRFSGPGSGGRRAAGSRSRLR